MDNSLVNMDNSSDRVVEVDGAVVLVVEEAMVGDVVVVLGEDVILCTLVVMVAVVEDTSVREPAALASLLQLDSSDASSQSGVPSQTQEFGIQLPSPQ